MCPRPSELNEFKKLGQVKYYDKINIGETISVISDSEIVFTDYTYIGKEEMDACNNIEYIGIMGTGTNSVDLEYAKVKNITVKNVPAYSTNMVSQYAFSLLLHGASNIGTHNRYVKDGKWEREKHLYFWDFPSFELCGKTLGIIGFGNIGKRSAMTGAALGMNVLINTRFPDNNIENNAFKFVNLDTILTNSDVIFLHTPLRNDNINIINEEAISKMKDGVIFINTARGKLVDENALAKALNRGKIAFAGLDVLADEPPFINNPLLNANNCFITPHVAWISEGSRRRIFEISLANLQEYLKSK